MATGNYLNRPYKNHMPTFTKGVLSTMSTNRHLVNLTKGEMISLYIKDPARLEALAPGTVPVALLPRPVREGNTAANIQDHKDNMADYDKQQQFVHIMETHISMHTDDYTKSVAFTDGNGNVDIVFGDANQQLQAKFGLFTLADYQELMARLKIPFDPSSQSVEEYLALHRECIATFLANNQGISIAEQLERLYEGLSVGDPQFDRDVTDFKNLNHPLDANIYALATAFFQTRADVRRTIPTAQSTRYAANRAAAAAPHDDNDGGGGKFYVSQADFQAAVYAAAHAAPAESAFGAAARPAVKSATNPFYCFSHGRNDSHPSHGCRDRPAARHQDGATRDNYETFYDAAVDDYQPPHYWQGRNGRGSGLGPRPPSPSGDWRSTDPAGAHPSAAGRGAGPGRPGGGGRGHGGRGAAAGGGGRGRGRA
jgi:hypothetical protein